MKKRWFCLLLAVMMLFALVGCGDKTKPDDKDTTTTTTPQAVAPIELVEGQIPADCLFDNDPEAIVHDHAVLLKANAPLTELRFLALNPDPPTVDKVLCSHDSLDEGRYWAIHTYINDAVPNRGIACTDENGKTYYYAIAYSMKGDGSPSLSLTELNVEALSEERLTEIETYLNAIENIGFVSLNEYTCPEEASLLSILYDGAGIGTRSDNWSEDELEEYLDVTGLKKDEMFMPVYRFARTDVEALILEKLGIPLSTLDIQLTYIEELDSYFDGHTDTNVAPVVVTGGWLEGGLYIVDYEIHNDTGRVTMRATDDGFQFVSNVEIPAATNTTYLSTTHLEKINTFLNDPDNLGFVQRTFDRPEEVQWGEVLTADITFGVDEREWSDAERQALSDALEYDMSGSPIRYPRAKVEELFQKRLGIPLSALEKPISAVYLAEYDAYYRSFLGIEWVPVYVKRGKIENGIYIVDYSFDNHDATRRVTMRATDDGFQFISNVSIEE